MRISRITSALALLLSVGSIYGLNQFKYPLGSWLRYWTNSFVAGLSLSLVVSLLMLVAIFGLYFLCFGSDTDEE